MTTDPNAGVFDRWKAHVAELEARFAREAEQLAGDLAAVAVELEQTVDVERAVALLERRDRAQRRLEALQAVRRRALGAAREAAAEAGERDDRLARLRSRLADAERLLDSPNSDDRANALRALDTLRPRLAELEQLEADDLARLELEAPATA